MVFNGPTSRQIARKEHQCTWCLEPIVRGEMYERWVSIDESCFTNKMHLECVASINAAEGRGSWEYCEGDGQGMRPLPGEFGRPPLQVTVTPNDG